MKYISAIVIYIILNIFISSRAVSAVQPSIISTNPILASSVEYTLPFAGLLPDHPLYTIKVVRDRILLFFTRDPEKKVHLNLLFSDKRLVMGQMLWEKGSTDLSVSTIGKGEKYLLSAAIDLSDLKKQKKLPPGLSDKVELAAKKHEEVITRLINSTSNEVKQQGLNLTLGINHQAMQQILSIK